jgi:hypothetical protein
MVFANKQDLPGCKSFFWSGGDVDNGTVLVRQDMLRVSGTKERKGEHGETSRKEDNSYTHGDGRHMCCYGLQAIPHGVS